MGNIRIQSLRFRLLAMIAVMSLIAAHLSSGGPAAAVSWTEYEAFVNTAGVTGTHTIFAANPYPRSALSILDFAFRDTDHHIMTNEARRFSTYANLTFQDQNTDDAYTYRVAWQRIPDSSISVSSGNPRLCTTGTCTHPIVRPVNSTFVLTGFYLRFANGDRHIKHIKIRPSSSQGTVAIQYEDGNLDTDDGFYWSIQYAWVPNAAVASNRLWSFYNYGYQCVGHGSPNALVMRGFEMNFNYDDSDHHLRTVTAEVYGGPNATICGEFRDNDLSRLSNIHIDYAELLP